MDPFRLNIVQTFYEYDKPLTVKMVSDALGEVPAKVHYHVKKLEKHGILVLVYTKEINGIIAKYYEPTAEDFKIAGSGGLGKHTKEFLRNNVEIVLDKEFNDTKELFIKSLRLVAKDKEKKDKKYHDKSFTGHLCSERVYLTEEEVKEFETFMQKFRKKINVELKNDPLRKEYKLFMTLMEVLDGIEDLKL